MLINNVLLIDHIFQPFSKYHVHPLLRGEIIVDLKIISRGPSLISGLV